jgi:peptide/nickel transport system permease protein
MEQGTASGPVRTLPVGSFERLRLPFVSTMVKNKQCLWALVILLPILLLTVLTPVLPLYPPLESNVKESFNTPSVNHFFGTDKLGRDIFSRTLEGIKISLSVGLIVAILVVTGGLILGTISGYYGGRVDRITMSVVDILLAFPSLLLAIGMVATMGAGTVPVIMAITIGGLPSMIRLQRSMVLSLRTRPFLDAARSVSAGNRWLMVKHIIPNTLSQLLVAGSIAAANAILTEASLSFLGLGITPPTPSLGNIIHDGQLYLQKAWWISTMPGVVILAIAISLHLFSDGIRQILDPKARK